MLNSQRISIKLSETRQRLNEIGGLEGDAFTAEVRQESDALAKTYADLEIRYRAALLGEGQPETTTTTTADPEKRELAELREKVHVGTYLNAVSQGRRLTDGPEYEFNQALGMDGDGFPLNLLLTAEERAAIDGDAMAGQSSWVDRVFAESGAMQLGITFESVAPGISTHPVTTAGAAGVQRGRAEAVGASTFSVSVLEMKPTRNTAQIVMSREDNFRLPGLEDGIIRDLREGVRDSVDLAVFKGDTGASGTDADITGLTTAAITEVTLSQSNKVKGPETLAVFANMIDGIYATSPADLRIVSTVGANVVWMSTVFNTAASNETIAQFLRANGVNWTTRGNLEANTGNGDFAAFIGLNRGMAGAGISAVWDEGELIRDHYSGAGKGEIVMTLGYYWNFALPRTANFRRLKFVT